MKKLILLNTPIGNSHDVTQRTLHALMNGKFFFVEDTRHFKSLLHHLGISLENKVIDSFHDHSDVSKIVKILKVLEYDDVYLASDAGSPIVSDPAYPLIKEVLKQGGDIDTLTGVSSVTAALELCGLAPMPFSFIGFLPREISKSQKILQDHLVTGKTTLFFESPARVLKTLQLLCSLEIECDIAVCRELTKIHQQVTRFHSSKWSEYQQQIVEKGEFVIVFCGLGEKQTQSMDEIQKMARQYLDSPKKSLRQLAKLLGYILDCPSKEVYHLLGSSDQS